MVIFICVFSVQWRLAPPLEILCLVSCLVLLMIPGLIYCHMWTEIRYFCSLSQLIFVGRINKVIAIDRTCFSHLALSPQASPVQGSFTGAIFYVQILFSSFLDADGFKSVFQMLHTSQCIFRVMQSSQVLCAHFGSLPLMMYSKNTGNRICTRDKTYDIPVRRRTPVVRPCCLDSGRSWSWTARCRWPPDTGNNTHPSPGTVPGHILNHKQSIADIQIIFL